MTFYITINRYGFIFTFFQEIPYLNYVYEYIGFRIFLGSKSYYQSKNIFSIYKNGKDIIIETFIKKTSRKI